jgi:hypothetical protein
MGISPHTLLQYLQELELEKIISVIRKCVLPDTRNIMTAVIFLNKTSCAEFLIHFRTQPYENAE